MLKFTVIWNAQGRRHVGHFEDAQSAVQAGLSLEDCGAEDVQLWMGMTELCLANASEYEAVSA